MARSVIDALGEALDWLILLATIAVLASTAFRGLTFLPSAGYVLNRPELMRFEQQCLAIGAVAFARRLLGGRALPASALWGLGAVVAVCLLSLAHTTYAYATREETFFLAALCVLIMATLLALNDNRKTQALIIGLTAIALAEAVAGLGQYFGGARTPAYWLSHAFAELIRTRIYGTLGGPNVLAGFLLPGIAGATLLAITLRGVWRAVSAAALVVLVVALLLTYSRGAYIGLAMFLAAGIGLLWPVRREAGRVLVLIVVVAILALISLPGAGLRAKSIAPASQQEDTATSRMFIWKTGLAMWRAHPLWGSGIGTFNAAYSSYREPDVLTTYAMLPIPGSAHDDYLQVLATTGVVGFGLIVGAGLFGLWRAFRRYARGGPEDRIWLGVWGAMVAGMATTSIVDENLFVVTNIVMLGLFCAAVSAHVTLADRPPLAIRRRMLIVPFVAALLMLPPLLPGPVESTVLHAAAARLVRARAYTAAVDTFREAVAADPLNGDILAYFGDLVADLYIRRINSSLGPWEDMRDRAEDIYRLAIQLNPYNAYPHAALGRLLRGERRYSEAAGALHDAITLDAYTPRYRLLLGKILIDEGDLSGAHDQLHESLRLYPVELTAIEHHEGQGPRFQATLAEMVEATSLLKSIDDQEMPRPH
jgi:O-antigen ligase